MKIYHLKNVSLQKNHPDLDPCLFYGCVVLRMLYDMAIDGYEKQSNTASNTVPSSISTGISSSSSRSSECEDKLESPKEAAVGGRRKPVPTLNLLPPPPEPVIVHPSIVNVMLQLLPTLRSTKKDEDSGFVDPYAVALQTFLSEVIQSLLRNEKNQQLMCDVEFLSKILVICKAALEDDNHVLNSPFQYLLGKKTVKFYRSLKNVVVDFYLQLSVFNCIPL